VLNANHGLRNNRHITPSAEKGNNRHMSIEVGESKWG
jgi:hypothetical protein